MLELFHSWCHMFNVPRLQVHLEIAPDSQNVTSESFDELKVNNTLRYEVLTEIFSSLGLSCEVNQTPALSPVHLLATCQVRSTLLAHHDSQNHSDTSKQLVTVRQLRQSHLSTSLFITTNRVCPHHMTSYSFWHQPQAYWLTVS